MNEKLAAIVGNAARAARDRTGLTQAEVAKLVDITSLVYSRMERGKLLPSLPTLLRLCKTLRASPNELLGHDKLEREPLKDPPELRRLLNLARKLEPRKLEALIHMVNTML